MSTNNELLTVTRKRRIVPTYRVVRLLRARKIVDGSGDSLRLL